MIEGLRKHCADFDASATAIKSSAAGSPFGRAAQNWAAELSEDSDAPKEFQEVLRKIKLAMAFAADTSLDSIQMVARAMAATMTACRNIWIRNWNADPKAQNRQTCSGMAWIGT